MTSPFDEAKYRALLEGLEAVEIRLSDVLKHNEVLRVDSEYFQKADLILLRRLEFLKSRRIGDFSYVTDGIHESIVFSEDSKINLISAKSPKENVFDLDSSLYINAMQHKANTRTALKVNDVVLSTVGTIGNCAVVDASILPANTDRHVGIIRIEKDFHPYVLSTFLLSRYGRFQTKRETTGNVQPNLFLVKIRELLIPPFSEEFQVEIEKTVIKAHQILSFSTSLHQKAEQKLIHTLGLEDWQPPEALTYERKSSDVFTTGRLDAEHFQPKYDHLYRQIKKSGIETRSLGEIILPVINGFDCRDFVDEGTPYIRVGDVKKGRIDLDSALRIPLTADEIGKDISLQVGDVLFTRKGSFGNAAPVWNETKHAVISSEIMLLRLCSEYKINVLPEYLALFLNSIAGNIQAEKWAHGAAFYSITQEDLGSFVIPLISKSKQEALRNLIMQSEAARKQAHNLLESAKHAVELAIEENETTAMKYLHQSQGGTAWET